MRYLQLPKKEFQEGQAVLVVLLVMSVLLTLGLSVISRSITDVKISQQSQESARAFWTAQAGLEKALLLQEGTAGEIDQVDYKVTKIDLGGSADFILPDGIPPGESFIYWLVDHNPDGSIGTDFYSGDNLTIYWGNSGNTDTALIATLEYKDTASGDFRSRKFPYDPLTNRNPATNFFSPSAGGSVLETQFAHNTGQIQIPVGSQPYFVNIKMLFNTTTQILGIKTDSEAPVQGSCFESTATVAASNIVRKLRECRTWPKTPEIFDYLLFSGGSIN